jgi:hypothetical protein
MPITAPYPYHDFLSVIAVSAASSESNPKRVIDGLRLEVQLLFHPSKDAFIVFVAASSGHDVVVIVRRTLPASFHLDIIPVHLAADAAGEALRSPTRETVDEACTRQDSLVEVLRRKWRHWWSVCRQMNCPSGASIATQAATEQLHGCRQLAIVLARRVLSRRGRPLVLALLAEVAKS